MSLADAIRGEIPATTRNKGDRYAYSGRVRLRPMTPNILEARVDGSHEYKVAIALDEDGDPWARCDCPAFATYGPCKHIWATAVVADRDGIDLVPGPFDGTLEEEGSHPGLPEWIPAWEDDEDEFGDDLAQREAVLEDLYLRTSGGLRSWRSRLEQLAPRESGHRAPFAGLVPADRRIVYALDVERTKSRGRLDIAAYSQPRLKRGGWGVPRPIDPASEEIRNQATPEDRRILSLLPPRQISWLPPWLAGASGQLADDALAAEALPRLCRTGRFYLGPEPGLETSPPLELDEGGPWILGLALRKPEGTRPGGPCRVEGFLERDGARIELDAPTFLHGAGFLVLEGRVASFDPRDAMAWVEALRGQGPIEAPADAWDELVRRLVALPGPPRLEIEGMEPRGGVPPHPHLRVGRPIPNRKRKPPLLCEITFDYDGLLVSASDSRSLVLGVEGEAPVRRDPEAERAFLQGFLAAGGQASGGYGPEEVGLVEAAVLPDLVRTLLNGGWSVEAEGARYRAPGTLSLQVRSGIDWFDLEGALEFEGQQVDLPTLIQAARRGSRTVALGDGSVGLLPEKWLEGWELLDALGEVEGGAMRFRSSQGWFLDALLAARSEVRLDEQFEALRERLGRFERIRPTREPKAFQGTLRPYQREGLAWLRYLEDTGLGGCLADDMGLGKTIQVLALLVGRKRRRKGHRPSLVVAPRSVVFNWIEEARRFSPGLRVLDYRGTRRDALRDRFDQTDLVVTTYGTLRRDIAELRDQPFDYAILDEAQAIKNAQSQAAKAARLIDAEHRLALSGTPIENHLGELWSLFEFLNPGMLGRAAAFARLAGASNGRSLDEQGRERLARAIRPVVLRRTKEKVLSDLPKKTEQVLHCELTGAQKRDYRRIREHVRATLLEKVDVGNLGQLKLHVLEALLRLRQAACHPGLLDPEKRGESAAKLEALLPLLLEVTEGGHKALVFSQFTRFLAIVRDRLDAASVPYEYMDGRTRKRQEKVDRFQSDPDCPVFLVSLKAGGLGLNLTSADYVFLLDPWWNPAVERQAVDRAHRIGQTRPVMAYRLIAKDTVEEKVLALQAEKRKLAEAVIAADTSVLKALTREDLEALFA